MDEIPATHEGDGSDQRSEIVPAETIGGDILRTLDIGLGSDGGKVAFIVADSPCNASDKRLQS